MRYHDNDELLYASDEGIGYFFTECLTPKIAKQIKTTCQQLGFTDYFIHGYSCYIEEDHFQKVDIRLS